MLIGQNIHLRPITVDDAALVAEWFSDPEYEGAFNNSWPQTRRQWERDLANPPPGHDHGMFLIFSHETNEPTGAIGYFPPFTLGDFFRGYEIWYQVHPNFRRRGIATQAACLLINHLFDATPIPRIQATIAVGNDASCRIVEAAGMRRDGLYRQVTFLHGRYVDMHLYAIVRDDWKDEASYRAGRRAF